VTLNGVELEADCTHCFGLCCVALAFSASADFAIDKPSGEPCVHLQQDFRCGIHADLRPKGFPGCTVFDCLGAGQHVSQVLYAGTDWRSHPATAAQMFEVFARVRELHMLLWHLREALQLAAAGRVHVELRHSFERITALAASSPELIMRLDVAGETTTARDQLRRASELARASAPRPRTDYSNRELIGAKLAGANLRGANLRGAQLIAADLHTADLRLADLTAADLRDTDLRGANLSNALFVRQSQLDAAQGDTATRIPAGRHRPLHWLRPD
jgi:hypothetical protein